MSSATLEALSSKLFGLLQCNFFLRERWAELREQCEKLAHSMKKYASELQGKNKAMKLVHASPTPWRSIAKGLDLFYIRPTASVSPELAELSSKVIAVGPYCSIDLHEYSPTDRQKRYLFIKKVKDGLAVPMVLLAYSPGNVERDVQVCHQYPLSCFYIPSPFRTVRYPIWFPNVHNMVCIHLSWDIGMSYSYKGFQYPHLSY